MPDFVCSLKVDQPQPIPPGGSYTLVRFPYGTAENHDPEDMHPIVQPDGVASAYPDPRSGLVWPAHDAWARLDAMLQWKEGDYTEIRDQFTRDPLNLSTGPDTTCTQDRPPTPGGQYIAKNWAIFVHPGTPIALAVRHNSASPVQLLLAEFKLSYHRCVAT